MKKSIVLFFLCVSIFSFYNLNGQIVSEKTARYAAYNILNAKNAILPLNPGELESVAVPMAPGISPEIFIFNNPSGGFVIVSGDKSATPIIGYSTSDYIPDMEWNSNFAYWMQNAVDQIKYYRQNYIRSNDEIESQWNFLLSENAANNPYQSTKAVAPFLRSRWGQEGIYNEMCPSNANGKALVGCVATAMAQVIYYYQFPKVGQGTNSYNASGYGTQYVNFGATTYVYEEMAGAPAFPMPEVAKLSYHCAVSVNMSFGSDGSAAYSWDVPPALKNKFRYASANYKSKMTYNATTWATMMRSNLDLKRPIIYSGSGSEGGHAFIMDGYEGTDYFHFDWGWTGSANGYFYLNALNPAGYDFTGSQQCVESIYPPTASYPYGCSGNKVLTSTFGTIEDGSGPADNYEANCNCSWLINPVAECDFFKITFEEFNLSTDDTLKIFAGSNASAALAGAFTGSTLPSSFNVNSSKVFIQFKSNTVNHNKGFLLNYEGHVPISCSGMVTLTTPTDTFDDGSGPNKTYGNSSFCRWKIQPVGATSITLNFLEFDMGDQYDYVKITNSETSALIGEYHKGDNPTTITVPTSKILVLFQSNSSIVGNGFKIHYTTTTDLEEKPDGYTMLVYPNPSSDFINIIPGSDIKNGIAVIVDYSGRIVYKQKFNDDKITISTEDFSSGLYSVGIISDNGNVWQKLIIE